MIETYVTGKRIMQFADCCQNYANFTGFKTNCGYITEKMNLV